jgi:hypothetical protein
MGVYQDCSITYPWFKLGLGPGAYIQVSVFRATMALLLTLAAPEKGQSNYYEEKMIVDA